jgi:hypothetical protein
MRYGLIVGSTERLWLRQEGSVGVVGVVGYIGNCVYIRLGSR